MAKQNPRPAIRVLWSNIGFTLRLLFSNSIMDPSVAHDERGPPWYKNTSHPTGHHTRLTKRWT